MAEFLLVADQVSPVVEGELSGCAAALALALSVAKHRVTIVSLATPDQASRLPGMARRLRTIRIRVGAGDQELSLYEGRSAVSQCALYALGAQSENRGRRSVLLASAANSLVRDQICWPDVVVGWGETSALALACAPSAHAAFVVPDGRWDQPLSGDERAELDPENPAVAVSNGMLVGLGAIEADVVVLPCPGAAEAFRRAAELSCRASDQPVTSMRFGCDELPHDPATDPALAATFSAESPSGKQECRRILIRRTSLAHAPASHWAARPGTGRSRDSRCRFAAGPRGCRGRVPRGRRSGAGRPGQRSGHWLAGQGHGFPGVGLGSRAADPGCGRRCVLGGRH